MERKYNVQFYPEREDVVHKYVNLQIENNKMMDKDNKIQTEFSDLLWNLHAIREVQYIMDGYNRGVIKKQDIKNKFGVFAEVLQIFLFAMVVYDNDLPIGMANFKDKIILFLRNVFPLREFYQLARHYDIYKSN